MARELERLVESVFRKLLNLMLKTRIGFDKPEEVERRRWSSILYFPGFENEAEFLLLSEKSLLRDRTVPRGAEASLIKQLTHIHRRPAQSRAQATPPARRCQGDCSTPVAAMSGSGAGSGDPRGASAAPRLADWGSRTAAAEVPGRWGAARPCVGGGGVCGCEAAAHRGTASLGMNGGKGSSGVEPGVRPRRLSLAGCRRLDPCKAPAGPAGSPRSRRASPYGRRVKRGGNQGAHGKTERESPDHVLLDIPVTREQMNRYRTAAETAQSELAALSVKYESARSELLELRSRMVSKEASFQELKAEAETYKENNARQMSLLLSLQTRIQEMEEEVCELTASKNQAELTAQVAFKENWDLKEKLHEQDTKLNKYLNECEESMTQASKISRKYEELLKQLSGFLDTDIREKEKPQEYLMSKVSEICKENLTLKDQVSALQEAINVHEVESKASRETIMKLVSEVTKEQEQAAGYYKDMGKLSKFLKFLEQLNEKMHLDSLAAEVGFDMNVDAILARVEQLVKLEGDAVIENKTMAYSLRRKLKTQKEKLESKELHVKLLRQKITQLEEEKQVRTALAVERDEANLAVRKLHKTIESIQKQLDLARETNTDLKAKLSETSELKIKTLEQSRTIEELSKSQGKLERMKEKAEKQLASVKSELLLKEREATEDKEKNLNMLEAVTSEMKVLKTTLAELAKRERQLADFREVVSRMLGLDIASLALPDYEIITCLEGLIHCHQHHHFPCICLRDVAGAPEEQPQRNIQRLH
ncbi:coiled-coil domain-containing protein 170 [Dryobates pubescens]|uniref:coiled-coil domain-containing protein 170 n=1 Tax=Dryobates pubescens TaxID=118200 RepID=UPI0023BA11FD|nr:coiled-coil domain-containing protein 170 [Dryobates pubescens]